MACVSELGLESVRVGPVDGGLRAAGKEVGRVCSQRERRASTSNLLLALDLHDLGRDLKFGDCAVSGAEDHIAVCEELHAVNAHREEAVARANALEQATLEVNLDNVTGEGADKSAAVIRGDHNALVDAFELTHLHVVVQNLLLTEVDIPDADTIVVDCHKLLACVIKEGDLVSNIHANSMADDGLSAHSLI